MKKISFILLAALLVSCLAGCHGSRSLEAFEMPENFDTSRDYEITFWAKNDTNKAQTDIYRKAISDFEACYPNIKVKLKLYTDYGRIYNDVITNIATKTTPNVCITYPDHIATYLSGVNTVVPLDGLLESEKYGLYGDSLNYEAPGAIIPEHLAECAFGGSHYAIPYMRSTEACYVNKTYVEALGFELPEVLTWDFIWEVSEAAMEKDAEGLFRINGQKVLMPFMYKSTDNMMIQALRQLDAPFSTADGDILIFNDQTKEFLYEIAEHAGTRAFNTFKISGYPANYLNAGQCIFAVDSTAGATWMGPKAPLMDISEDKIVDFEVEVFPVPQFDPEDPVMISQGPSVCVFNRDDPQEVLASWLFAQFLLTDDVQTAYSRTEGYVPVTESARTSEDYLDYLSRAGEDGTVHYDVKIKASLLLLENTDRTFVTPVFNGSASLRDAAGQMIENVTKSMRRGETVDEKYMENLFKDVTSLCRLDQIGMATSEKQELEGMPSGAVALIVCICCAWLGMCVYVFINAMKSKKRG